MFQTLYICALGVAGPALSAEATLKIGLASETTSIDPHFWNAIPNNQMMAHIYEPLVGSNPDMSVRPALAESWRRIDDQTWEFKLRKKAKFHDGSPFTANDVIFSFCRVPQVVNSPGAFTIYTAPIAKMTAPDPHTLVVKTKRAHPLFLEELPSVLIISAQLINGEKITYIPDGGCKIAGEWPKTADFDSGKYANGTGPYRFAEFVKGNHLTLRENPAYWGDKLFWNVLQFRYIPISATRMAALASNEVDIIENPPVEDALRLQRKGSKHKLVFTTSVRTIYLAMDQRKPDLVPVGVSGTNGKNPFADIRVRQALSMAIDRHAITYGVMKTFATPAEQLLMKRGFGVDPVLRALPYDPDAAKKLLAEAGYPRGFEVTLFCTNDRYINDEKVCLSIAAMWSKIGVKTNANTMSKSIFFPKQVKNELGVRMAGWGQMNNVVSPLRTLVATPDKAKGYGVLNVDGVSDSLLDGLLDKALSTMDDDRRREFLRQASRRATQRMYLIPIHHQTSSWALRNDLTYAPRVDELTFAFEVAPAIND